MDKNNNKHVFLIAEIGINHNGDLDIVKKLIIKIGRSLDILI